MISFDNKLVRYFFTAGAAAVVDVGGFAALCRIGLPIPVAAVTSFCAATVVNYLLTSRCVFHQTPTVRGFGVFFVAAVGGLTVNVSVTLIGSLYLGILPVLAKMIGVGTAFLVNFWLNLRIVFRPAAVEREPQPLTETTCESRRGDICSADKTKQWSKAHE